MRPPPRLPSRRHAAPPRERFVTALFLAPPAPLTLPLLEPFWKMVAALGPAVARVVLVDRSGEGGGEARLLPGLERMSGDAARPEPELLAALLRRLPAAERRVVAVATAELTAWADDEIAEIDDYAARVVARFAATATRGAAALGAVLSSDERLGDLAAIGPWPAATGEPAVAPFDLRALRRLRDLDVAPGDVTADLVAGMSGVRGLLARAGAPSRPRLAVDRLALPAVAGVDAAVQLEIEGWIVALPPVRHLVLAIGARRYPFAVDLERDDVAGRVPYLPDTRCGFRIAGHFGPFPPGRHEVGLERADGRKLRRLGCIEVASRQRGTALGTSSESLRITRCEVHLTDGQQVLSLAGELLASAPVHSLRVEVDGRRAFDVDRRHFRGEAGFERSGWRTFHVEEAVSLEAGGHTLRISARRGQAAIAEVSTRLTVPTLPLPARALSCPELERLARDAPAPVWGAIRLRGEVRPATHGDEVELWVDRRRAELSRVKEDGRFELRLVPESGSEHEIELRLVGKETRLGPAIVVPRELAVPEAWPAALETVLAALGSGVETLASIPAAKLARLLAEEAGEDLGRLDGALRSLAQRVDLATTRPAAVARDPVAPVERPLKVLFASWEIPWSGHGGGTCMVNLLRALGTRHEVTVLHPTAPGSEGLSDEVRPMVREILAVPRGWQRPTSLAPFGTPERYLWTFSPDLRRALAAELHSGKYDVANLEYEGLYLQAPDAAPVPALFVMHELVSFARLAALSACPDVERDAGLLLRELVGALYFDAVAVPDRFAKLATLTAPEAQHLLPFLPGREVAVLPIPVDTERLQAAALASESREPAAFVFVGTFRHPPNLAAAEELVSVIAPLLRARLPHAVVRLVGADPPPGLVDRAAVAGVEMLGWVDDLASLLARSTAFLAPLRQGAGMRVKLLEAMAAGCPVVTTALGMSGIAAAPGEAYLQVESSAEFVEAAVALASSPPFGDELANRARAVVERDHGIATEAERRERIWAAMLAERAAR